MIALLATLALSAPPLAPALPFIEDDYAAALAQAQQRHLPILVDAWTTWCHSCRYLRATLMKDPAVAAQAGRFVWLSMDTEKAVNADFDARFPVDAWPTFLFIDPSSQTIALRWAGSLSTPRFLALLDEGERAVRGQAAGALAAGRALDAARKPAEAAVAYGKAVEAAPAGSPQRGKALEAQIIELQFASQATACAQAFLTSASSVPKDGAYVDAVTTALACALDGAAQAPFVAPLRTLATAALSIADVNDDDRSSLYETLIEAEKAQQPNGKAPWPLAGDWLAFLDQAAARAASTEQRAALDPHRIEAAEAAGDVAHVRPLIERTARELPNDYNAHARLSTLYRKLGLRTEALAANQDALNLAYGPRRLRLFDDRVQMQLAAGDATSARATVDKALGEAAALPASQRPKSLVEKLSQERDQLASTKAP